MPSYSSTITSYTEGRLALQAGLNLSSDTLKALLLTSSYTPNLSTDTLSGITANECSGAGYARVTLAGNALSNNAGDIEFTITDFTFTANGADITTIRYCVIYDDTPAGDPLLYLIDLTSGSPTNFTLTDGNDLNVNLPAVVTTLEFSA